MIVFDTTALSLLWVPGATASNRHTKRAIKHAKERLEALIEEIAATDDVIIIPSPVLSEIIIKIPNRADELLKRIKGSPWFKVEAFDAAAAVELGLRTAKAMAAGDKREGMQADWTKVKFDRQIVSIAIVTNAALIISDDGDIAAIGERWNVLVKSIEDLPIPSDLIPPPLLANLEEKDDEPSQNQQAAEPPPPQLPGGSSRHSQDKAAAEIAKEKAEGKDGSSAVEEANEIDLRLELSADAASTDQQTGPEGGV
jgi:hypothetical protein